MWVYIIGSTVGGRIYRGSIYFQIDFSLLFFVQFSVNKISNNNLFGISDQFVPYSIFLFFLTAPFVRIFNHIAKPFHSKLWFVFLSHCLRIDEAGRLAKESLSLKVPGGWVVCKTIIVISCLVLSRNLIKKDI